MGLRLVDLGRVGGLRSQTAWHAIAEAMKQESDPVLSLQQPSESYVSIGFHRSIDEIDRDACDRRGLAVYRRRAGGGPVLCDQDQLFFQIIVPTSKAPAMLDRAWRQFLAPAVEAFQRIGLDAHLSETNDILVGDRKVSGLGAATIGEALVFVGNVIFDFDYAAMVDVLALPSGAFAREAERLMRRYLAPVREIAAGQPTIEDARRALVGSYGDALGPATVGEPSTKEETLMKKLDELFLTRAWVETPRPRRGSAVKIRAGVGVFEAAGAVVSVIDGRIESVVFGEEWVAAPGMGDELERALRGLPIDLLALSRAAGASPRGDELASAIVAAHQRGF